MKIMNPILPGFYPDPSICAVGEDFYLVNSTFTYFPGVPIFHSKDLKNWTQIGNVLSRESQVSLEGQTHSAGIFAPNIMYNKGVFYMITTNIGAGGNFYVTATNPEGPWSEPTFIEGAVGIDPSLFFDDDGKIYYVGQRENSEGPKYYGDCEIWLRELDVTTGKLIGEDHILWRGSLKHTIWTEGPHVYKVGEYYYVMIAESGTAFEHSITIARSKNLFGEYFSCPMNPIITHRHLGRSYPVINVGHGDMFQDKNGQWYMVMLASRPREGYCNMGRETFLAKVEWEEGWPVVNPGVGVLTNEVEVDLEEKEQVFLNKCYHFYQDKWEPNFVFLHNPDASAYEIDSANGILHLHTRENTLKDLYTSTFVGIRQQHHRFKASTRVAFQPDNEEEAGITLLQSNEYHVTVAIVKEAEQRFIKATLVTKEQDTVLAKNVLGEGAVEIELTGIDENLIIRYRQQTQNADDTFVTLADNVDIRSLSTEVAGGFVGCTVGLYGTANHLESNNIADFNWLSYTGL